MNYAIILNRVSIVFRKAGGVIFVVLEELKTTEKVVGVKQLQKKLLKGAVKTVFIAADADPALTDPILQQCRERNITVVPVATMRQLGAACGISVSAAAAATL